MGNKWWYNESNDEFVNTRDIKQKPYITTPTDKIDDFNRAKQHAGLRPFKNKMLHENTSTDEENYDGISFNYALLEIPANTVTDSIFLRDGVFDFTIYPYPSEIDVASLDYLKAGTTLVTEESKGTTKLILITHTALMKNFNAIAF